MTATVRLYLRIDQKDKDVIVRAADLRGVPITTFVRNAALLEAKSTLARTARVVEEANSVFGDPKRAKRWLTTRHPVLGNEPMKLVSSNAGAKRVLDELTRIHYGDYA